MSIDERVYRAKGCQSHNGDMSELNARSFHNFRVKTSPNTTTQRLALTLRAEDATTIRSQGQLKCMTSKRKQPGGVIAALKCPRNITATKVQLRRVLAISCGRSAG
jgi:hypothetical protein